MRTKLFIASALTAMALADAAFAGTLLKAKPTVAPQPVKTAQCNSEGQPCCTPEDCCLECILCCAIDGCCEECILCCIEMGCDPSCCFPTLTSAKPKAPKKGEACCTKSAKTAAKDCCRDGCCK